MCWDPEHIQMLWLLDESFGIEDYHFCPSFDRLKITISLQRFPGNFTYYCVHYDGHRTGAFHNWTGFPTSEYGMMAKCAWSNHHHNSTRSSQPWWDSDQLKMFQPLNFLRYFKRMFTNSFQIFVLYIWRFESEFQFIIYPCFTIIEKNPYIFK